MPLWKTHFTSESKYHHLDGVGGDVSWLSSALQTLCWNLKIYNINKRRDSESSKVTLGIVNKFLYDGIGCISP